MAQLATSLLQQLDDPESGVAEATEIVHAMPALIEEAWLKRFAAKIGITTPKAEDTALVDALLSLMQTDGADFTNAFRALSGENAADQFTDRAAFANWHDAWQERNASEPDPIAIMQAANPAVIPRNHRIEAMINAAVAGDMDPFHRLMAALARPYQETDPELHSAPTAQEIVPATFCGT